MTTLETFWYGSRRRRREAPPAGQNPAAQRREDSWQTPDESTRDQRGEERPPT
ncbi:hypothetical protein ACWGHA_38605 [Streptomyces xanthophaeus]